MPAFFARKASDADTHLKSMESGDLTIALSRVGSFRADAMETTMRNFSRS